MGVTVQQQVEMPTDDLGKGIGVREVLVVGGGLAPGVVVDYADPGHALYGAELVGEPAELLDAAPAVVVLFAVAFLHRGVQRGHRQPQVLEAVQPVRPVLGERRLAVQRRHERLVMPPLLRVRLPRRRLVPLAVGEVPRAQPPVHVMVARDDDHPLVAELSLLAQRVDERPRLLVLRLLPRLGDVTGEHDQVDRRNALLAEPAKVPDQVARQGVDPLPEPVVSAELGVGHVKNRRPRSVLPAAHPASPRLHHSGLVPAADSWPITYRSRSRRGNRAGPPRTPAVP
jgi:hypothetical protein